MLSISDEKIPTINKSTKLLNAFNNGDDKDFLTIVKNTKPREINRHLSKVVSKILSAHSAITQLKNNYNNFHCVEVWTILVKAGLYSTSVLIYMLIYARNLYIKEYPRKRYYDVKSTTKKIRQTILPFLPGVVDELKTNSIITDNYVRLALTKKIIYNVRNCNLMLIPELYPHFMLGKTVTISNTRKEKILSELGRIIREIPKTLVFNGITYKFSTNVGPSAKVDIEYILHNNILHYTEILDSNDIREIQYFFNTELHMRSRLVKIQKYLIKKSQTQ